MTQLATRIYLSPVGPLHLVATGPRLCGLSFAEGWQPQGERLCRWFGAASMIDATEMPWATDPLDRYFAGDRDALREISVELAGTPFQQHVWTTLRQIPGGQTWTYAQVARAIGRPTAVRAVGAANGANPIAIVLPCHRVVGSTGALTGYGGGLERKRQLLVHERALLA